MSSVQHLREFISERLTAAAGEIFSEFEKTIVQLEEEIDRQRRLLDISLKPQVNLHRIDLPLHYVWNEEEVLTNHQLWNQERNSSLDQNDLEPSQMKDDQEETESTQIKKEHQELFISQDEQQVALKQETDTFMVSLSEERDGSKPEANRDQPLPQNSPEADNQNQERSRNKDSEVRDEELKQKRTRPQTKDHRDNVVSPELKIYTGEKRFSCKHCKKCFSQSRSLTLHMRSHTSEMPYLCKMCGIIFSHKLSLTFHMRTHTDKKPFSCETCGKCFSQRHHLANHMKCHTGEKINIKVSHLYSAF